MPDNNESEVDKLRRTNAELLEKAKQRKEKIAALTAELAAAKTQADERVEAANARLDKVTAQLHTQTATAIANEVFVSPKVGLPYLSSRIKVAVNDGGDIVTTILASDGKDTDLTLGAFKDDLRKDKSLSAILKGSRGSGSGAAPQQGGGSGVTRAEHKEISAARIDFGLR